MGTSGRDEVEDEDDAKVSEGAAEEVRVELLLAVHTRGTAGAAAVAGASRMELRRSLAKIASKVLASPRRSSNEGLAGCLMQGGQSYMCSPRTPGQ